MLWGGVGGGGVGEGERGGLCVSDQLRWRRSLLNGLLFFFVFVFFCGFRFVFFFVAVLFFCRGEVVWCEFSWTRGGGVGVCVL